MRFAIDIRYDNTPIAGISVDTQEGETPDAIAKRVAENYARDAQQRRVTTIDPSELILEVRSFVRHAAEAGGSRRKTISFVDGKPFVSEMRMDNVVRIGAIGNRPKTNPADNITVHLVALSNAEIADRRDKMRNLMG